MTDTSLGKVILLNGTSSAGKTTLTRAIQELSDVPYLHTGIDAIFAMVPPKWGGGRGGPLSREGFRYDRYLSDHGGQSMVEIQYGPVGRRVLEAAYQSIAVLPRSGLNVVIDEMLLSPDLIHVWRSALAGLDVLFVGVHCSLEVAEERERTRVNPRGLARGHLRTVHAHGIPYDHVADTTDTAPERLAEAVLERQERVAGGGHLTR